MDVLEPFSGEQYGTRTEANDIANNGWVVGASTYGELPRQRACVWIERQPFNLEARVPVLRGSYRSRALRINEKGQILAEVGFNEYYLLTPKNSPF